MNDFIGPCVFCSFKSRNHKDYLTFNYLKAPIETIKATIKCLTISEAGQVADWGKIPVLGQINAFYSVVITSCIIIIIYKFRQLIWTSRISNNQKKR